MVNVSSKVFEGSDVGYCRLIGQRGQTHRRISSQGAPVARGAGQPCLESLPRLRASMNCTMSVHFTVIIDCYAQLAMARSSLDDC